MYLQHWGLDRSPFGPRCACYPSAAHEEAEARAEYLLAQGRRLGVLLATRGGGKSTSLRALVDHQRQRGANVAVVEGTGLTDRELLWQVATQFGFGADVRDESYRLWRRIETGFAEQHWRQRTLFLAVDDASQVPVETQQQLVRLLRLEPEANFTALLALEPTQLGRLDETLLHLVDLRIDLYPWDESDTVGFVQSALIEAGRLIPVFTEDALAHLHALTQGAPRHVSRLADFAMLTGAGLLIDEIDAEIVQAAFDEICWSPTAPAQG